MRGDMPKVAFRLLTELPVTTHMRTRKDYEDRRKIGKYGVVIDGREFPSEMKAARALGVSRDAIRRMIKKAEAA